MDTNHEKHERHENLLYPEERYAIQGAVFDVYRYMGSGFLEAVYQECLEEEFKRRDIPYTTQDELQLFYKGTALKQFYKSDFICYGKIILELKAVRVLLPEHEAQMLNYLKATGMRLGLLINFASHPKATIKPLIL